MNPNKKTYKRGLSLMALFLLTFNLIQAQQFNLINKESSLTVFGTSSLHDWHISAEQQSGKIIFKNLEAGEITTCTIDVVVESLKSGKSSMDKNTYKALNSSSYKTISFQLIAVKETVNKGNGKFTIKAEGDLTISGVKKRIPLDFSVSVVGNKITLTGEKKIKMTDFKVDPPKALLGTITTGDDITIKFSTIFK
ncbi:YceI family protein [Mariniflexile litorale]|uniref:YceI family protein n=1 Tax=Mariniflexile litorale TaxID=3045158 RepID=A0AAU7EFI2_9FLAO|nr:YceI family protein [Mariniflexile sp. KMM 9835]MDQ8210713.1 YceI family protein [Mariniflexile sp. KMM 9835]